MKDAIRWILLGGALLLVLSCSTAAVRVMPGPEGVHRAAVRARHEHKAEVKAVKAAAKYCRERDREAIFLADGTEYTGSMSEEEREAIHAAAHAADVVAGTLHTIEAHDAAAIFATAGGVGHVVTSGKDYEAEVEFRCDP